MSIPQIIACSVLVGVVGFLIWGKARSDVVALGGAAVLLVTRTVRPIEVQSAFASPALIALASLFVIAYAMELSGLLGVIIKGAIKLCARLGGVGIWIVIGLAGFASAFLNNTPIVVLSAPVVRDVARSMDLPARRFLIPLSYASILGGACTLIGTSTNLLVNDMARTGGQAAFRLFEVTPVGLIIAAAGAIYLFFIGAPSLSKLEADARVPKFPTGPGAVGDDPSLYPINRPFQPVQALTSLAIFLAVVTAASMNLAPIAALAFTGAVALIVLRVITAEDAYRGLRPDILLLIAGMVVIGISLEVTGLAAAGSNALVASVRGLNPLAALALIYGATLFLTEILSNAAVAVLITPVAIALAESLGVSPRPFIVGVMMAASAAFATPFGYQTNVLVYKMGGYGYLDFVKVGVPLNLLTWFVGVAAIPQFFPF